MYPSHNLVLLLRHIVFDALQFLAVITSRLLLASRILYSVVFIGHISGNELPITELTSWENSNA